MNQLSAPERETILGLLRLRWSIRRICRETGHRHETVRRIGQEAGLLQPLAPAAKPHTLDEVPTDLVPAADVAPAAKEPSRSGRSTIGVHAAWVGGAREKLDLCAREF
jgi:hypothetical protein